MALWVTVVLALACLGGLAAPGPVPSPTVLRELIEELVNITQDQKVSTGWLRGGREQARPGPCSCGSGRSSWTGGLGPAKREKGKPGEGSRWPQGTVLLHPCRAPPAPFLSRGK